MCLHEKVVSNKPFEKTRAAIPPSPVLTKTQRRRTGQRKPRPVRKEKTRAFAGLAENTGPAKTRATFGPWGRCKKGGKKELTHTTSVIVRLRRVYRASIMRGGIRGRMDAPFLWSEVRRSEVRRSEVLSEVLSANDRPSFFW